MAIQDKTNSIGVSDEGAVRPLAAPVLVLGATGFIGRHLVAELLNRGYAVRAGYRSAHPDLGPKVGWVKADLQDRAALEEGADGAQAILLAAGPAEQADSDHGSFVNGVDVLAHVLRRARSVEQLVVISTVKVYGEQAAGLDEASAPKPVTAYGRSRLDVERVLTAVASGAGMRLAILRLPPVYGPACKGNLGRLVSLIARGVVPPLPRNSGPRSLVHVRDVARAAAMLMVRRANGVYVVTDGIPYSLHDIYRIARRCLGKRVWPVALPAAVWTAIGYLGSFGERLVGRALPVNRALVDQMLAPAWYSDRKLRQDLGHSTQWTLEGCMSDIVSHCGGATAQNVGTSNRVGGEL